MPLDLQLDKNQRRKKKIPVYYQSQVTPEKYMLGDDSESNLKSIAQCFIDSRLVNRRIKSA